LDGTVGTFTHTSAISTDNFHVPYLATNKIITIARSIY